MGCPKLTYRHESPLKIVHKNPDFDGKTDVDYYPFGMPMPNRQVNGNEQYRYAFQGQEKDEETGKEAFELRLWDGRIGRWLTIDPKGEFDSPSWCEHLRTLVRAQIILKFLTQLMLLQAENSP